MAAHKVNMNNFRRVQGVPEGVEKVDLEIIPMKLPDDSQPAPLLFMSIKAPRKKQPKIDISDIPNVVWNPSTQIEPNGSAKDYMFLVNWWFESATAHVEYNLNLQKTYRFEDDKELISHFLEAQSWLVEHAYDSNGATGKWATRRTDLRKFLKGWLVKDVNKEARRRNNEKKYRSR